MKTVERSIIVAFIICILLNILSFSANCNDLREKILRLHVVANSDSRQDQQLKLDVRDSVLEKSSGLFSNVRDKQDTLKLLREHLPRLCEAAQSEVYRRGYDYPVRAQLCKMYFPTRQYDNITLPAGMYDAVRITIGQGKGQNWWCVMFPPMCVPSASEKKKLDDVLTGVQSDIVRGGTRYKAKFKIVEIFESIFSIGKSKSK